MSLGTIGDIHSTDHRYLTAKEKNRSFVRISAFGQRRRPMTVWTELTGIFLTEDSFRSGKNPTRISFSMLPITLFLPSLLDADQERSHPKFLSHGAFSDFSTRLLIKSDHITFSDVSLLTRRFSTLDCRCRRKDHERLKD